MDATTDAPQVDALPDAQPPEPDPGGTIAVLDLCIVNQGFDFCGGTVNISYPDTITGGPGPVVGNDPPDFGSCAVWVYEVGQDAPAPATDEGAITISDTLSPVGTCAFDGEAYRCSTGGGTLAAGASTAAPNGNGLVTLFSAGAFEGTDLAGSRVVLSGFTNAANNGAFVVMGQDVPGNSLTLYHPGAVLETLTADGSFTAVTAAGPTPANRVFLGNDTNVVTIEKEAGTRVEGFSVSIGASGQGLTLASDSATPDQLPVAPAADAVFSCDPANSGQCGPAGGFISGFVLSGSTTDADITGLPAIAMPDPVNRWARFQCRSMPGSNTITLTQEAMQALLDSGATRIETQLFRVTAELPGNAHPYTSVVVGHGVIGYTDVPAP